MSDPGQVVLDLWAEAEADLTSSYYDRSKLFERIRNTAEKNGDAEATDRARWEECLWRLDVVYRKEGQGRFQPIACWTTEDGGTVKVPDPDAVPAGAFAHFRDALVQTKNPFRRARYGDFLWEKDRDPAGKRPIGAVREAIDAYIACGSLASPRLKAGDASDGSIVVAMECADAAIRACELALSIGDTLRIANAIAHAVDMLEDLVRARQARWAMDIGEFLAEQHGPKVAVDLKRVGVALALGLEQVRSEGKHQRVEEHLSRVLAVVYEKAGDRGAGRAQQLAAIESRVQEAKHKAQEGNWMAAAHFYQNALEGFRELGEAGRLDELKIRIKEAWQNAQSDFKTFEVTMEIPHSDIAGFFTTKTKAGLTLERHLDVIAAHPNLRPSLGAAKESAARLAEQFVLQSLIPRTIISQDNPRFKAETDEERRELAECEEFRRAYSVIGCHIDFYLRHMVEQMGLTADRLAAYLASKPLLRPKAAMLRIVVDRWFAGDHVSVVHLLVPHLESLLRGCLPYLNEPTTMERNGEIREADLGSILGRRKLLELLGEDLHRYFCLLLHDSRGDRLRHVVAHGLIEPEHCTPILSAILLHCLLALGLFGVNDGQVSGPIYT